MSEEVVNKANEVLVKLLEDAQNVRDFVVDQAPDVVQQLLMWHFWAALIPLLAFVVVGLPTSYGLLKFTKWGFGLDDECAGGFASGLGMSGLIGCVVWLVVGVFESTEAIKIAMAPKLYLLEYAAELVK